MDDPFWNTHAPQNGWRCRCSLTSVSQTDYDKGLSPRGEPLNKTAPAIEYRNWYNAKIGKSGRVPVGMVDEKIFKLEQGLARKVREDLAAFARNQNIQAIAMTPSADIDFAKTVKES